jgi:hypothetical protein
MRHRLPMPVRWARNGAILALALSLATLMFPTDWGAYNPWSGTHLVVHNLAAIATRVAVFALIGAALGALWAGTRGGRFRH